MEKLLKERGTPLCSLESKKDLKEFDIVGFSLLYELNFTNILTMLDLSSIPFYSDQRGEDFPLIIAGGPCAFNPEPLADLFDLFVIGDGEEAILEISKMVIQWKRSREGGKKALLKELAAIQGVYVPSFYTPSFNDQDLQILEPLYPEHKTVRRAILSDLAKVPFPTSPHRPIRKACP